MLQLQQKKRLKELSAKHAYELASLKASNPSEEELLALLETMDYINQITVATNEFISRDFYTEYDRAKLALGSLAQLAGELTLKASEKFERPLGPLCDSFTQFYEFTTLEGNLDDFEPE